MSTPTKRWCHVTIGTYASWYPGDQRGFRSRGHKLHCSGDPRNPPPPGEHVGLRRWAQQHSDGVVTIPPPQRSVIGHTFVDMLKELQHEMLIVAVGGLHVHLLARLPNDRKAAKHEIGRCKRAASFKVRDVMSGKVWARDCGLKWIVDRAHQHNAFGYIFKHWREGAWVWTFQDGAVFDPAV